MALLNFFRRDRASTPPHQRIARFLDLPEHAWIAADRPLLRSVALFLAALPTDDLEVLLEGHRLLLLYCNQRMSCSLHQFARREIVLVFPELRKLLCSAQYLQGHAVLAHEVAHILLSHTQSPIEPMEAQLAADGYARRLGLGEDLISVLSHEEPGEETRVRLEALRATERPRCISR